jgi:uncharacterized protein YndB with AHSA1/START domain
MPARPVATNSITVKAPIEQVWKALTNPELIKQWFLGVDTTSDWMVGSSIVHRGEWEGKPYEDKGEILRIEPPKLLVHSHWSEGSGLPDRPENYQTVTYELSAMNGDTEVIITEVNFPNDAAKALSEKTWKTVLGSLKELLEK